MKASFQKRVLKFKKPAGTSRGILLEKPSWYLFLYDEYHPAHKGIGECSVIPGLSPDDELQIEPKLAEICRLINAGDFDFEKPISDFPAISFAVETALLDFQVKGSKILFPSSFTEGTEGIAINGLIWMDQIESMLQQVEQKIEQGFKCIKLKIGTHEFHDEMSLLRMIRSRFSAEELCIRVDANGAYSFRQAFDVVSILAKLEIHSIEQPIIPSQLSEMAELCRLSPVPIALDEELIGKYPAENKRKLIEILRPQYLVFKPSLLGGFRETTDWINIAGEFNCGWWVTSALESNIGLNAIAQWTSFLGTSIPQGLGTGNLFSYNIESPLVVRGEKLFYDPGLKWNYEFVY